MEILNKLSKYSLFSHIEETPVYYFIHSKVKISAYYGGKYFIANVSFKINKKNYNLKMTNSKLFFNKNEGDYEYVFVYANTFLYGNNCYSLKEAFKYINDFFEQHEKEIEEYI